MTATEITTRRPPAPAVDEAPQPVARWPLFLIAAPAAVAVWSGWVGLGGLCGFGIVHPLPGITDGGRLNTAITLPVGVEAYGAYALGAWLTPGTAPTARTFARRSALGALALGMAGQVIYHLLAAAHAAAAPWPVVMLVSCLPVLTLGFGAALTHLLRTGLAPATIADTTPASTPDTAPARLRTPRRTRRGQSTAARVAALRARHPDMTAAEIAARLKVSDRTVRRHLSATHSPDSLPAAAA
jgi:DNA-binding transcriptional ArsR family regulator